VMQLLRLSSRTLQRTFFPRPSTQRPSSNPFAFIHLNVDATTHRSMSSAITTTEKLEKLKKPDGSAIPVHIFTNLKGETKRDQGIVVIQEWWGINDQIKQHAQYLADQGYVVLVPDLYRGKLGLDVEEASHLMNHLDFKEAVNEIDICARYLREGVVGRRKVGVTGYCMGGALTLATAALTKHVDVAVSFYGIPPAALCDLRNIKVPVQAHFGELDNLKGFSDPDSAQQLESKLKQASIPFEVYLYPGQGHAFMNGDAWSEERKKEIGAQPYNAEAAGLAWKRTFAFLNKYLRVNSSL